MKARLITLVLLVCFCLSAAGQVFLGIAGGAGLDAQTGAYVGIPIELRLSPVFRIHTEVSYVLRGDKEILRKLNADRDYRHVGIDYLRLPLFLKLHLDFEHFSLFGACGPTFSYGLGIGANYVEEGALFREKLQFSTLQLNPWEFGAELTLGFEGNIRADRRVFAAYRYYLGLNDVDLALDTDLFHQGGMLFLGFLLPLSKRNK